MERIFIFKKLTLLLSFVFLLNYCSCIKTNNNLNNDILPLLIEMPDQIEFEECKPGLGQIILEAKYRVSGKNAYLIEDLLNNKYEMGKLQYTCCGWETNENGKLEITNKFNDKYKTLYNYNFISISMYSEETLIQDRNEWDTIPYFYVIVRVLNI